MLNSSNHIIFDLEQRSLRYRLPARFDPASTPVPALADLSIMREDIHSLGSCSDLRDIADQLMAHLMQMEPHAKSMRLSHPPRESFKGSVIQLSIEEPMWLVPLIKENGDSEWIAETSVFSLIFPSANDAFSFYSSEDFLDQIDYLVDAIYKIGKYLSR
jgi:hypothetical protein